MDNVHEFEGKWYFWNEVQSDRMGPYSSEDECRDAMKKYAANL